MTKKYTGVAVGGIMAGRELAGDTPVLQYQKQATLPTTPSTGDRAEQAGRTLYRYLQVEVGSIRGVWIDSELVPKSVSMFEGLLVALLDEYAASKAQGRGQ